MKFLAHQDSHQFHLESFFLGSIPILNFKWLSFASMEDLCSVKRHLRESLYNSHISSYILLFYKAHTHVNYCPYKESIGCISEASQMSLPINNCIPSLTNTASILLLHSIHVLHY